MPAAAATPPPPPAGSAGLRSRQDLIEVLDLRQLSEREVARRAGLGHATVNFLVTGRRTSCSPDTAQRIEEALQCPPGLLFTRPGRGG